MRATAAAPHRCVLLVLLALAVLVIVDSAAIALDQLDVYASVLPAFIAKDDVIDDLELRVYLPATADTAINPGVRVTPTCSALVFAPCSFVFTANASVAHFRVTARLANGSYTVDYVVTAEPQSQPSDATSTGLLLSQSIRILPQPLAYAVSDVAWHGIVLLNDSFDALPTATGVFPASGLWSRLAHAFPSKACGAFDGSRALYFTALGDRFADTAPLALRGFHGKMHFAHVYGRDAAQTYDTTGDNRVACERVDAGEETVFSYLPNGRDAQNDSAWQPLYQVPLVATTTSFTTHSVLLPSLAMHAASQFRWQQLSHSSFPIDVAATVTKDALAAAANDNTSVNGALGRNERALWRYRNLFDQWAIDNVKLEVRLDGPLFSMVPQPGSTAVTVESPIANSWVELLVGDGTHAFPTCTTEAATAPTQTTNVQLHASGYVHAVVCLNVNASLMSSFPTRSPLVLVQARAPQVTSVLDATTSVDTWQVTLACNGCDYMRFVQTAGDGSDWRDSDAPSCVFGTLVDSTSHTIAVVSNARLQVVACGRGLVPSDIVASEPFVVRPRTPKFVFIAPEVTITRRVDVTIVASDAVSVGVAIAVGTDAELPDCASSSVSAGNRNVQVDVADVVYAVACCVDRLCDDSAIAVWGPLVVHAAPSTFSTACSRLKPLTVVVALQPVTADATVRYVVGASAAPLTCLSGSLYTAPFEVAGASTTVYAISCGTGLLASASVVVPITVDTCCAGLRAFEHAACAHVLLLADDFRTRCLDATKWTAVTQQWGGRDVSGGVHANNVACVQDDALGKSVLALRAHGDLFPGISPVGTTYSADDVDVLTPRTVDDALLEWALDGASTVSCTDLASCAARRVGAAIQTKLALAAGVLVFRLQPCIAFGTLTQVWIGELGDTNVLATVPFLSLWKAALNQAKTAASAPFVLTSPAANTNAYVELAMQWDAVAGRANLFVDSMLVARHTNVSSQATNSTLSLGVWFPNAVAGMPLFETCSVLVDSVQVFKPEVAGDRWCDARDLEQQHSVDCASDADCQAHVLQVCFMAVYEAACITIHDELSVLLDADTNVKAAADADITTKRCRFRLSPAAHSSAAVTDMSSREQRLHWDTERV